MRRLAGVLAVMLLAGSGAADAQSLRERARQDGDIGIAIISCGGPTGWQSLAEYGQLAVEGVISEAHSALTPDETDVYTEYLMDVVRVLRAPPATAVNVKPGAAGDLSPFVAEDARARPGATRLRVRFRSSQGTVVIEGYKIEKTIYRPILVEGQHVIVFAHHPPAVPAWFQFRVFEVRDGRVIPLDEDSAIPQFDSVDQFAEALRNPPPAPKK